MSHPTHLEVLQVKRDQLKARLVEISDMRPGSLVERFRKCGKRACHCAEKDAPGHGPCYSLTHAVEGKTVTRIIPKGAAVERTRQQIAEYHRFRDLVRELITVSEQICDAQMPSARAPGQAPVKKTSLAALLATDIVHEIEALVGRQAFDGVDLEALEMAVRQQALQLAARAVEQRLNADTSDNAAPHLPCRCGGEARYAGRRSKRFHSALGSLQWQRAYYHWGSCGGGFCPRDRSLGLENSSLSPAVTRMVGTVGALVSFQEGSELLQELAGVAVDAKQVERTAEALGTEIAAAERKDPEARPRSPSPSRHPLSWYRWNRHPSARRGVGGTAGQAVRWVGENARGQALHRVERRISR